MFFASVLCFSQERVFNAKVIDLLEFNYETENYDIVTSKKMDFSIAVWEESFIIIEGDKRGQRIDWYKDREQSTEDIRVLYTENREMKIVFNKEKEIISIFSEYNLKTGWYEKSKILSDIKVLN